MSLSDFLFAKNDEKARPTNFLHVFLQIQSRISLDQFRNYSMLWAGNRIRETESWTFSFMIYLPFTYFLLLCVLKKKIGLIFENRVLVLCRFFLLKKSGVIIIDFFILINHIHECLLSGKYGPKNFRTRKPKTYMDTLFNWKTLLGINFID